MIECRNNKMSEKKYSSFKKFQNLKFREITSLFQKKEVLQ